MCGICRTPRLTPHAKAFPVNCAFSLERDNLKFITNFFGDVLIAVDMRENVRSARRTNCDFRWLRCVGEKCLQLRNVYFVYDKLNEIVSRVQ